MDPIAVCWRFVATGVGLRRTAFSLRASVDAGGVLPMRNAILHRVAPFVAALPLAFSVVPATTRAQVAVPPRPPRPARRPNKKLTPPPGGAPGEACRTGARAGFVVAIIRTRHWGTDGI